MTARGVQKILFLCVAIFWSTVTAAATLPDAAYVPRLEVTGSVSVLTVQPDGKTLVAGDFSTINGTGRYQLARLNLDGSLDTTFALHGFEVLTPMYLALAVQADGKILVGGQLWWMTSTGVSRQNLARLNSDGSLDASFDAGQYSIYGDANGNLGLDGAVRSIVVQNDGKILVGGDFTRVRGSVRTDGLARAYLARLNADGSTDTSFDPGIGANALVRAMALQPDGKVLAAGDFASFNGISRGGVVRLTSSGAVDTAFAPGAANGAVHALAVQPDGRIAVGGDFTMIGAQGREHAARLNADGSLDAWSIPLYFWSVKSVVALADNSIVLGGWNPGMIFNGYPTDHDAHIQIYDSNGTVQGAQYFQGKPTEVLAMALRPDGTIIVGGSFNSFAHVQGEPVNYRHGLVLLNANLSAVSGFHAVVGRASGVTALLDRGAGKVLVAGGFNLVNGVSSAPLVQLNADGSLDNSFNAPALSGAVTSVVALPDGSLAVAGGFKSADGTSPGSVLHLTASGALTTPSSNVYAKALAVAPDGKLYLGGSADASFRGVLRLNAADWSIDNTFAIGTGLSNSLAPNRWVDYVNALTMQPDGKLLLVGQFDQFNGSARSNVVRLNVDGSVDTGFVPPVLNSDATYKMPEVFAVTPQADGKVLVGGYFQSYGDPAVRVPGLVRLNADGSADTGFVAAAIGNTGGEVRAIALDAGGKIVLGGGFQVLEGNLFFNYFARLNADGTRDTSLEPSFSGAQVTHLLVTSGRILAGGDFYQVSGVPAAGLAAFGNGLPLVAGWNLLGNSSDQAINPVTLLGDKTTPTALSADVVTAWAWDAGIKQWAFFAPSMTAAELASYAASKGYLVLQSIAPRQGFWLNSNKASALPALSGNAVSVTAADLVTGWNLMSDARSMTPSAFHASLGTAAANYTTLWAWDATKTAWLFHSPALEAQGGTKLVDYINGKGYLDFSATGRSLAPGSGFWVNRP
ncbi:MAG: hypothetical protein COW02_01360 [Comamonadaceae bacterium CG12_big_fil_rev_8_21_14_0_65_59_15]|nr:MAG: hypothetical protein COW02_01360 [Comamonadaceae bacterium CG12_big_fil_rev_8_21_14_0_65_59_15]